MRVHLLVLALVAAVASLTGTANAFVYFTYGRPSDQIGRAGNDGSNIQLDIVGKLDFAASITGPASDGRHLYWLNSNLNTIGRSNLDGSEARPNFSAIAPRPHPPGLYGSDTQLAIGGGHIYFAVNGSIGRVRLDGSYLETPLVRGYGAQSLAVSAHKIYWAWYTTSDGYSFLDYIGRANLDGSDVEETFIGPLSESGPIQGLATDSRHIYWSTYRVGSARLDGSGVQRDFMETGDDTSWGLAVRDGELYWPTYSGYVVRGELDDPAADTGFIYVDGVRDLNGVAVDGRSSPETTVTRRPARTTYQHTATIRFRSNRRGAAFECRLGHRRFETCRSPARVLVNRGEHRFRVRATTVSGPDPSPATVKWTVVRSPSRGGHG